MDLTGGMHKGKPNLFGEIVERRKNEGDFKGLKIGGGSRQAGPAGWAQQNMLLIMAVIGTFIVLASILGLVFISQKPGGNRGDTTLPRNPGSTAPVVKPTPKSYLDPRSGKLVPLNTPPAVSPPAAAETAPPATAETPKPDQNAPFRPLEPQFKTLSRIDPEVFEGVWDDEKQPTEGNNLKADAEVQAIAHLYRFLRSHSPEELAALADTTISHDDLLRNPEAYRGKVLSLRVQLKRKYMVFDWPANDSGVRDTSMIFCYGLSSKSGRGMFVVLVPKPPEGFEEDAEYVLTGVFFKRYPFVTQNNMWRFEPLVLALAVTRAQPSEEASTNLIYAAAAVAVAGILLVVFMVRGETRESEEKRRERLERRRLSRARSWKRLNGPSRPPEPPGAPPPGPPPPNAESS